MGDDQVNTSKLEENVTQFLDAGCGCSGGPGGSPCYSYSLKTLYYLT